MKRLSLMSAAFVPFVAMAAGGQGNDIQVDTEKLRKSVPATALLSEEVLTREGEEVGDVEDIVIRNNGEVVHFLVDADLSKLRGGEERLDRDPGMTDEDDQVFEEERVDVVDGEMVEDEEWAADERVAREDRRAGDLESERWDTRGDVDRRIDWMGEEFTPVKPDSIRYDDAEGELIVEASKLVEKAQQVGHEPRGLRVSEIIGMEVNLSDEDSFGQVEDVMISEDGSEVVALVVDNWDGLEKNRRALPMDAARINYEDEEVTYMVSLERIEQLPEFNLDEFTEDGWQIFD